MIVQCAAFPKSLNPRNIEKSVSDILIRIRSCLKAVFRYPFRLQTHYSARYPTGKPDSDHLWKPSVIFGFFEPSVISSDFQIWKISGPGLGYGIKNFGTGAESESEKVTPATSRLVPWTERQRWADWNFPVHVHPNPQKLNPIKTWSAKFLKIIGPIQSWSTHVKPCMLFCLMRQNRDSFLAFPN